MPGAGSAAVLAVALVLPAAMTTFGLGVKTGGPVGVTLTADGLADKIAYAGELAAVDGLCAAIPKDSSVIIIDGPIAGPVHRDHPRHVRCPGGPRHDRSGRPPDAALVRQIVQDVRRAGRQPVLLAATASELKPYGGLARKVMTTEHENGCQHARGPTQDDQPAQPDDMDAGARAVTAAVDQSRSLPPDPAGTGQVTATPYVTVVLPCYNEQDHVLLEIARISEALDASEFRLRAARGRRRVDRQHPRGAAEGAG